MQRWLGFHELGLQEVKRLIYLQGRVVSKATPHLRSTLALRARSRCSTPAPAHPRGMPYRWSLATNSLTQRIRLTAGLGEACTPTAISTDGAVYAINNATLFSVGQ